MISPEIHDLLRALPAVDQLAARLSASDQLTPAEAITAARAALEERRRELLAGQITEDDNHERLMDRARRQLQSGPRRVLNATGVIIHTNLGRAPLADAAVDAVTDAARGYLDLEYDIASGTRGQRDAHVRELLCELTGAEDATVVNNGAAATLLAAAALAGPGKQIVVSRGELIEIGGGFRIPDVVAQAGSELVEVGTTNRTKRQDYERAVTDGADVILKVHQSNFRTVGFTEDVPVGALTSLGVPVIDDLGSGVLTDRLDDVLSDEPAVRDSVRAGAALVAFSGDKLLGGPQAGILVGTREAIAACRRHPLARAMRLGRLPLAALAATLKLYRDPQRALTEIPVLAMLNVERGTLEARAAEIAAATGGVLVEVTGKVGGGALPLIELNGPAVAFDSPDGPDALAARLRSQEPPLITRIVDGRVIVDPRTLAPGEIPLVIRAIDAAVSGCGDRAR